MRRLNPGALGATTRDVLSELQASVDAEPSYAERVSMGKELWAKKTGRLDRKAAFAEVREVLARMSPGQRCHYCEDSYADEIEHFRPKDLYPDHAFRWDNYLYSCGPCNGPKNNRFAVLDPRGALVEVTRGRDAPVTPPVAGRCALLNPREEDPLDALRLDLHGTFFFTPVDWDDTEPGFDAERLQRTEFTIDVLRLNERSVLVDRREKAFESFLAILGVCCQAAQLHADAQLEKLRGLVVSSNHRSVWESMKRQAREGTAPGAVLQMFALAEVALDW